MSEEYKKRRGRPSTRDQEEKEGRKRCREDESGPQPNKVPRDYQLTLTNNSVQMVPKVTEVQEGELDYFFLDAEQQLIALVPRESVDFVLRRPTADDSEE